MSETNIEISGEQFTTRQTRSYSVSRSKWQNRLFEPEGSVDIDLIFELPLGVYPVQENVYISVQSAPVKLCFRPENYKRVLNSLDVNIDSDTAISRVLSMSVHREAFPPMSQPTLLYQLVIYHLQISASASIADLLPI